LFGKTTVEGEANPERAATIMVKILEIIASISKENCCKGPVKIQKL
jgi:hypothetical protein